MLASAASGDRIFVTISPENSVWPQHDHQLLTCQCFINSQRLVPGTDFLDLISMYLAIFDHRTHSYSIVLNENHIRQLNVSMSNIPMFLSSASLSSESSQGWAQKARSEQMPSFLHLSS
ncbi:hypothetical protein Mapa_011081 [Marchantia paleacea]|nr:hypothetical protein Mapa_011081 [Marchantia paleacea]